MFGSVSGSSTGDTVTLDLESGNIHVYDAYMVVNGRCGRKQLFTIGKELTGPYVEWMRKKVIQEFGLE